jgi:hypothetical protein
MHGLKLASQPTLEFAWITRYYSNPTSEVFDLCMSMSLLHRQHARFAATGLAGMRLPHSMTMSVISSKTHYVHGMHKAFRREIVVSVDLLILSDDSDLADYPSEDMVDPDSVTLELHHISPPRMIADVMPLQQSPAVAVGDELRKNYTSHDEDANLAAAGTGRHIGRHEDSGDETRPSDEGPSSKASVPRNSDDHLDNTLVTVHQEQANHDEVRPSCAQQPIEMTPETAE